MWFIQYGGFNLIKGRIYKLQKLNFSPEEYWLSSQKKANIYKDELDDKSSEHT